MSGESMDTIRYRIARAFDSGAQAALEQAIETIESGPEQWTKREVIAALRALREGK